MFRVHSEIIENILYAKMSQTLFTFFGENILST